MRGLDKRGISPLIATILLIAFAVALGAVIINWGRGVVEERNAQHEQELRTNCATFIRLQASSINGDSQICAGGSGSSGYVEFSLDNKGNKKVNELSLLLGGKKSVYQIVSLDNSAIIPGGALLKKIPYNIDEYGELQYVRFVPKLDIAGESTTCASATLQINTAQIRSCEQ
ncbi:hypothetical protein HYX10_03395 [Candidatus Woesearchaeota archaeon]|nr:hypothetical protein [Candidatus Woesearchaeota archaeon]